MEGRLVALGHGRHGRTHTWHLRPLHHLGRERVGGSACRGGEKKNYYTRMCMDSIALFAEERTHTLSFT